MAKARKPFTFGEFVALLLVVGVVYVMFWWNPRFDRMKSDLNRLAEAESEYRKKHGVYMPPGTALNISELNAPYPHKGFTPSPKVMVVIYVTPDGHGWWAEAYQDNVRGFCAIFAGTPLVKAPATEDNVPACTRRSYRTLSK